MTLEYSNTHPDVKSAVKVAVLEQKINSIEEDMKRVSVALEDIKTLVSEIKGGYKVTSTLIMICGTLIGIFASVFVKGYIK